MTKQFKSGDFAVTLINLPDIAAGSVVELIEELHEGDRVPTPQGVLVALVPGWICKHPDFIGRLGYASTALMPLGGGFQPVQQSESVIAASAHREAM